MHLVLYEPDIPQNAGAMMRLAACLSLPLELIEPCGFALSDRRLRRAGMDYLERLELTRHLSYAAFSRWRLSLDPVPRLILLTTRAERSYLDFAYAPDDFLMVGRESAGVPEEVHADASARLKIPLARGARSLNVALAAAMVLGEALRQTGLFPEGAA